MCDRVELVPRGKEGGRTGDAEGRRPALGLGGLSHPPSPPSTTHHTILQVQQVSHPSTGAGIKPGCSSSTYHTICPPTTTTTTPTPTPLFMVTDGVRVSPGVGHICPDTG